MSQPPAGRSYGMLFRVSLRRRLTIDLAIGLLVTLLAMGVVYWQASTTSRDTSAGHTFRLLCPLH
jgi:CHASE3 domain sensor protein